MGFFRSWQAKLARITGRKSRWDRKACVIQKSLQEVKEILNPGR